MHRIITIERQYGSGGSVIGKLVAENLGIKYYHQEIPQAAAQRYGMDTDVLIKAEGNRRTSILYALSLASSPSNTLEGDSPLTDRAFFMESQIIDEIVRRGEECVIVGRCGNFIADSSLSVYIYSTVEERLKRAVREYGISQKIAETLLKENDSRREIFFNSNTGRNWRQKEQYSLCLNSAELGDSLCAEIIANIYRNSP